MNEEKIMENNEVVEAIEETVQNGSGLGLKIIGGVIAIGGAIYGGYKLRKVLKAKKEQKAESIEVFDDEESVEFVDEEDSKN